jgi:hypothetical protein
MPVIDSALRMRASLPTYGSNTSRRWSILKPSTSNGMRNYGMSCKTSLKSLRGSMSEICSPSRQLSKPRLPWCCNEPGGTYYMCRMSPKRKETRMSDELLCVQCQCLPVARLGGRFCSVACKTRYHAYIPKPLKAGICQHRVLPLPTRGPPAVMERTSLMPSCYTMCGRRVFIWCWPRRPSSHGLSRWTLGNLWRP